MEGNVPKMILQTQRNCFKLKESISDIKELYQIARECESNLEKALITLLYKDDDGDMVKVETQQELETAINYSQIEGLSKLHFFVIEQGYEPILENPEEFECLNMESPIIHNPVVNEACKEKDIFNTLSNASEETKIKKSDSSKSKKSQKSKSISSKLKFNQQFIECLNTGKYPCPECNSHSPTFGKDIVGAEICSKCSGIGFNQLDEEMIILKKFFDFKMQKIIKAVQK